MADTDCDADPGLYEPVELGAPNPFTALKRAGAVDTWCAGPEDGLEAIARSMEDKRMARHHRRIAAVRTCAKGGRRLRTRRGRYLDRGAPRDQPARAPLPALQAARRLD